MDIIEDIKTSFKEGSVLTRLIYVNLAVFLFVRLAQVLFFLAGKDSLLLNWLALPEDVSTLLTRPWTIITYMFLHFNFLHILFNLLGLYWFGKIFLSYFDEKKLLSLYILGGIAGGVLYILAYNLFPVFQGVNGILMGASASIIAILVAVAAFAPNQPVYLFFIGRIPLKYVAAFWVFLSVLGISTSNAGGNFAHLGGALWGFFYIRQLGKGKDYGSGIQALLDKVAALFKPKSKIYVSYKQPPRDDYEYNRQKNQNQEEINRILEKISKSGYGSLSKKEKELLFKIGKK
ncbi:MAG: rhomboid family intramembrane serine protease [Chlorobi bacterium]|nr:rhomboid family intramembrane serine protease [Chlorobiota bacterium]